MSDTTNWKHLQRRLRRRATGNPLREQMLAFVEEHGTDKSIEEVREAEEVTGTPLSEVVKQGREERF
jgi:hypothetical protein